MFKMRRTIIVLILILIILGGLILYFKGKANDKEPVEQKSTQNSTNQETVDSENPILSDEEYISVDTSDEILKEIDESIEILE